MEASLIDCQNIIFSDEPFLDSLYFSSYYVLTGEQYTDLDEWIGVYNNERVH